MRRFALLLVLTGAVVVPSHAFLRGGGENSENRGLVTLQLGETDATGAVPNAYVASTTETNDDDGDSGNGNGCGHKYGIAVLETLFDVHGFSGFGCDSFRDDAPCLTMDEVHVQFPQFGAEATFCDSKEMCQEEMVDDGADCIVKPYGIECGKWDGEAVPVICPAV